MRTECSPDSLDFASLGGRNVTAAFDGGAMTSNAGALLLRETDRLIGLSRQSGGLLHRWPQAGQDRAQRRDAHRPAHSWHCAWLRGSERSR